VTTELDDINGMARKVLEIPFWPDGLPTDEDYFRQHDDHDGDITQGIRVLLTEFGDVGISTGREMRRFRPFGGGGQSMRVRNAILLLALAIKLDNEDHPMGG
jgi:hypothetical protein